LRRPYVILAAACSVDGRIATRAGDSSFSSARDLRRLHRLRASVDAIMIGIGTLLSDDPELSVRLAKGRTPLRVVVDSRARTPPESRLLATRGLGPVLVAVAQQADEARVRALGARGAEVVRLGKRRVDLRLLLGELWKRGIRRLLLEGGSELNWAMLRRGLVDELRLFIRPVIVGGRAAKPLAGGRGASSVEGGVRLKLLALTPEREGLYLRYRVLA